jgi:hypothetical protein
MHELTSPNSVVLTKSLAPQSGMAVLISAMAVCKSAIMEEISFPDLASAMNYWISLTI